MRRNLDLHDNFKYTCGSHIIITWSNYFLELFFKSDFFCLSMGVCRSILLIHSNLIGHFSSKLLLYFSFASWNSNSRRIATQMNGQNVISCDEKVLNIGHWLFAACFYLILWLSVVSPILTFLPRTFQKVLLK